MAEWRDEIERAREEARRAREEAQRLRGEASRLRNDARAEADRLRQEARNMERRLREEVRSRLRDERAERRRPGPPPDLPPFGHHWRHGASEDPPGEGERVQREFPAEGVRELEIEQTAGRLHLRPCAPGETPGIVSIGSRSAPRMEVERQGERLRAEIRLSVGWLFRRRQGANTVVRVPPGLARLHLNVGYGNVQVRELVTESFGINIGAGDFQAYANTGAFRVNVGAGKIALYGHRGLASCDTGTGDVLVDLAALETGDYRVNAGIGRVEVRLPPGQQVRLAVESGLGRARVEYPAGPDDSPVRLVARTGVGEAVVRARPEGPEAAPRSEPVSRAARGGRPDPGRRREAEELRVLQLLEQRKITVQEAAQLIAALQGAPPPAGDDDEGGGSRPNGDGAPPSP